MKNRVISIILCLCMIIPCFTILGFAEGGEAVNTEAKYN